METREAIEKLCTLVGAVSVGASGTGVQGALQAIATGLHNSPRRPDFWTEDGSGLRCYFYEADGIHGFWIGNEGTEWKAMPVTPYPPVPVVAGGR